jgi:protein-S-isoprenylcysteine O-methyltransferase Ste14
VIDTGPYAIVRHPGYISGALLVLSMPLMLGSWWALLPALMATIALAARTPLEERTLRAELPGYADYTQRVKYRWVPGVW